MFRRKRARSMQAAARTRSSPSIHYRTNGISGTSNRTRTPNRTGRTICWRSTVSTPSKIFGRKYLFWFILTLFRLVKRGHHLWLVTANPLHNLLHNRLYNHIELPSRLMPGSDYNLFKSGKCMRCAYLIFTHVRPMIRPVWWRAADDHDVSQECFLKFLVAKMFHTFSCYFHDPLRCFQSTLD